MSKNHRITPEDLKNVVDMIVPLERNGDVYDGYCPFCSSNDEPSFIYDVQTMKWKCQECRSRGSVIDLVQQYNRVTKEEAKQIIKDTVVLFYRKKPENKDDSPVSQSNNKSEQSIDDKSELTSDIVEENTGQSNPIDELTGLILKLRSVKGYLGLVASSVDRNYSNEIPDNIGVEVVEILLNYKNHVKERLQQIWYEHAADPLEILLSGDDMKVMLVQATLSSESSLDLCLLIEKESPPSMFQLHIRNSLSRINPG